MLKRYIGLVVAIVVALVVGAKALTPNHFHTHDDIQIFRTNEFVQCFRDGQFPCRWSRDLGKGYGYPLFVFYPPTIYAIPAIIAQIPNISIAHALNIFVYLTFPLSAYSMYRLIKTLTNRDDLAGVTSVLFTMLPYHAVNVFVRGVYAENLVWAIAPLLLTELYLVIVNKKPIFTLTMIGTLIILTHNISAMILIPIVTTWAGVLILANWQKNKGQLIKLVIAGLWAAGIAAWFLLPALLEKPLVQTESMIFDYYSYLVHFPSLRQIFFSNNWGYGGSSWGTGDDGMSFALGQVQWILLVVVGLITIKRVLKQSIAWGLGSVLLLILFLAHPRSTPIWVLITPLQYIQFPWRLVGMAGMLTVALSGYLLSLLPKKVGLVIGIVSVTCAIMLYGGYFHPEKYDQLTDQDYIVGDLRTLQQQDHLFDYLPKTVQGPPPSFAKDLLYESEVPVTTKTQEWKSNQAQIQVNSEQDQTITLSIYSYPGWIGEVNRETVELVPSQPNGLITVPIVKGDNVVLLKWKETLPRKIANAITFVSLSAVVIYLVSKQNKGKVK